MPTACGLTALAVQALPAEKFLGLGIRSAICGNKSVRANVLPFDGAVVARCTVALVPQRKKLVLLADTAAVFGRTLSGA